MFSKALFYKVIESRDCLVRDNPLALFPSFKDIDEESFLKTLWEKKLFPHWHAEIIMEKGEMLVTTIFPFFHNVFLLLKKELRKLTPV